MQASILLVLLAAAMGTFGMPNGMPNGIASSAPAAPNTYGMIGNYTIMDVGWKGKVFDNGEDVYLNGSSLQHIVEQIKVLNPDHKFVKLPVKEKRQSYPEYTVCENKFFADGTLLRFTQGETYLDSLSGLCYNYGGKGTCGRVSCSYNTGIFFCSDADHTQYINCREIADYSRFARTECGYAGRDNSFMYNSQRFRTDTQYNVLDAYSKC